MSFAAASEVTTVFLPDLLRCMLAAQSAAVSHGVYGKGSGRRGVRGIGGDERWSPEDEANILTCLIIAQGWEIDEQYFSADMLGNCIGHHGLAHPTCPMEQQHQPPTTPNCTSAVKSSQLCDMASSFSCWPLNCQFRFCLLPTPLAC